MIDTDQFEKVQVSSPACLRDWLLAHHKQDKGVWLVTFKKHVDGKYVTTGEVLDALLAFGWIDGVRRKLDDNRTMQLITPRRAQHWSKTYKDRVAKLRAEGQMHEAGERAVAESKKSGRWTFLDDVDALQNPPDLDEALDALPPAKERFLAFSPSSRRFVLRWIKLAKTEKTRSQRIARVAELAARNKRLPGS